MSRYVPNSHQNERSRSPPRFNDRRPLPASSNSYNDRSSGPGRSSDSAARGSRSQYDAASRPPPSAAAPGGSSNSTPSRPGYSSLRDAPPLTAAGDRGRSYRERDCSRDRVPSPRERSPSRPFKDARDYPPRELDIGRARRDSRDGPLSAGSSYTDNQPFSAGGFRSTYSSRGRGRGDFGPRSTRGGRPPLDDRDLFRRERSPPPRWGRDLSRDSRDADRRFDRRDDDRRADWTDRERDLDRPRRESSRLDTRPSAESPSGPSPSSAPAPPMDPSRRAIIESTGADPTARRMSVQQDPPPKRDAPETPAYLNGRAETTANRYGSRGSSPPTQAPPVPAFTLSFGTSAASAASAAQPATDPVTKPASEEEQPVETPSVQEEPTQPAAPEPASGPPAGAPTAPRAAPPPAAKPQLASPPPAAPRAPQALRNEDPPAVTNSLHTSRSLDSLTTTPSHPPATTPSNPPTTTTRAEPSSRSSAPEPPSPVVRPDPRFGDLNAPPPTGPRATRMSPAQTSVSPHLPLPSPRPEAGVFQPAALAPRAQTPPLSAPSGPRSRSFSVSPKVTHSSVPTEPKADRAPPSAPRGAVPANATNRPERFPPGAAQPWAPPSAPRSLQQPWNQWRRPPAPGFADRVVPAKRDSSGEEKTGPGAVLKVENSPTDRLRLEQPWAPQAAGSTQPGGDSMDVDKQPHKGDHSARQSFFGQPGQKQEEEEEEEEDEDVDASDVVHEPLTSSDDDESDLEDDITLFNAKFERQKRHLESQMIDLSQREYRATTPLESIARLARISVQDWERFKEQRENEMELDETSSHRFSGTKGQPDDEVLADKTAPSSESGDASAILTPKGEDDARVVIRSSEDPSDELRRRRRPSPEPIVLPYLLRDAQLPFDENETFRENLKRQEECQGMMLDAVADEADEEDVEHQDSVEHFARAYRRWRIACEELDRIREEQEALERQQSLEPNPEPEAAALPILNPMEEGRRWHKNSSEYEILQVLKESEEMARVEQERQDREAKKMQADMEKEATAPDQMTPEEIRRSSFIDTNRFREAESLTVVFTYEPPADDFDANEQAIFAAAFKETPKKWGEIASLLPNRTYKDCIHHYYTKKWDGRFRDHKARRFNGRRGRGNKGGGRRNLGLMNDLRPDTTTEVSDKGRPRRAAAPTTFGEKEVEPKASAVVPSPIKKSTKQADASEAGSEKPSKRQKKTGERTTRKTKGAAQQAASLPPSVPASVTSSAALATGASPNKHFVPGLPPRENPAVKTKMEEATLLADFAAHYDRPVVYHPEQPFVHMATPEETERTKGASQPNAGKPTASSYWSVPEQTDFVKYIGYFGRDYAAIAHHMGTKTQTMIKNHYQRQIDSGNKRDLELAALDAEDRRSRGEDMGNPPTPTPIQKRKYDQPSQPPPTSSQQAQAPPQPHQQQVPQPPPQQQQQPQPLQPRSLAPQGEPMDIDDGGARGPASKPPSPPPYQPQPRFPAAGPPAALAAPHSIPGSMGPVPVPSIQQLAPSASARQIQHPLGSRMSVISDARSEAHTAAPLPPTFHPLLDAPAPRAPPRIAADNRNDAPYFKGLGDGPDRAMRAQHEPTQKERIWSLQRNASQHRSTQGSPVEQHLPGSAVPERKSLFEDRAPSPPVPRGPLPPSAMPRPPFDVNPFSMHGVNPLSSMGHPRAAVDPSPPKHQEPRPGSVPLAPLPPPAVAEPPKRSNLLSLLNSESDEPARVTKESRPPVSVSSASPAPQSLASSAPPRREPGYASGQDAYSSRAFYNHSTYAPMVGNPAPTGSGIPSHESWPARVLSQTSSTPPTALDRDGRSYLSHSHRSGVLSSLDQPNRANPSPPPIAGLNHSRTSSLSGPPRDQRAPNLPAQPSAPHQPHPSNLQANPYASAQSSPYTQPLQPQTQSLHGMNSSPFPSFSTHGRAISRDDYKSQDHHDMGAQPRDQQYRDHKENNLRWSLMNEPPNARPREDDRYHSSISRPEPERSVLPPPTTQGTPLSSYSSRTSQQHRHPPQPFLPPTYSAFGPPPPGPPAGPAPAPSVMSTAPPPSRPGSTTNGGGGLREQSMREAEGVYMRESTREREQLYHREHDQVRMLLQDEQRRREQQQQAQQQRDHERSLAASMLREKEDKDRRERDRMQHQHQHHAHRGLSSHQRHLHHPSAQQQQQEEDEARRRQQQHLGLGGPPLHPPAHGHGLPPMSHEDVFRRHGTPLGGGSRGYGPPLSQAPPPPPSNGPPPSQQQAPPQGRR